MEIYHISINQEHTYLQLGTSEGFIIYKIFPFICLINIKIGPIKMIQMANSSKLLLLVGYKDFNEFSPKRIVFWGENEQGKEDIICSSLPFLNNISKIFLNKSYFIVAEGESSHIFDTKKMKNLVSVNFGYLSTWAVTPNSIETDYSYIIYSEIENIGYISIYNISTFSKITKFKAHNSLITNIDINYDNTLLATSSEKGTIIRIFSIPTGEKCFTFKRGVSNTTLYTIQFGRKNKNILFSYSSNGTIHFFNLECKSKLTDNVLFSGYINYGMNTNINFYISNMVSGIKNMANTYNLNQYEDLINYTRSIISIKNKEYRNFGIICEYNINVDDFSKGKYITIDEYGMILILSCNFQNKEGFVEYSFNVNSKVIIS